MNSGFLTSILSSAWSVVLIALFFGGSIFVHELGHFLAARWRGVKVTRFSIGFGPKIFGWTGKDGVEYRLSWLPLGGYVALPQLADMRAIEGEPDPEAEALPPITYASRMIVFAAGATFNVIFAFLLACVIWVIGLPEANDTNTTTLGVVYPTVTLPDGASVPGPAFTAGLKPGDTVRAVDGRPVADWNSLRETLMLGTGRTADGRPQAVFTIERGGRSLDITLQPVLAGAEKDRLVGITPLEDYDLVVGAVPANSPGALLGFKVGDHIVSLDGRPMRNLSAFQEHLVANKAGPIAAQVKRGDATVAITIPPRPEAAAEAALQLQFSAGYHLVHPNPFVQLRDHFMRSFRTLASLVHPRSDIGFSKLSGPVGIVTVFYSAASAGIAIVIWLTILINISLAIFNLLPIPVLDGGHMLFATIGKLRGRPLPMNFVMTTQSVFMVLLLTMIVYVTFFDIRRLRRTDPGSPVPAAAPAQPAPAASAPGAAPDSK